MKGPNVAKWGWALGELLDREREKHNDEHQKVVDQLDRFLSSEGGATARALLFKTKKDVVVAYMDHQDGMAEVLFLDEGGWKLVSETKSVDYPERPPTRNTISSIEFVKKAIESGKRPDEILPIIFRELDKIADEAIKGKDQEGAL